MEERKLGDAQWHTRGAELLAAIIAFLESPAVSTELKVQVLRQRKEGVHALHGHCGRNANWGKKHLRVESLGFASAVVDIDMACTEMTGMITAKNKNRYGTVLNAAH